MLYNMNKTILFILLAIVTGRAYAQPSQHPNVIIILIDDMGYGDT